MKFIHVSDFHLGKRLHGFSMMEDQKDILNKIIGIIREETPDGVFLAGDVYDKAVPPAEAVRLFDDFLWRLSSLKLPVFVISGNHDSPERISFGSRLLNRSGIHMSPVYDGTVIPVSLEDTLGILDVYMLPFIKPVQARKIFQDETIESYTDAVRAAISHMELKKEHRNVLITHQFVTGAIRSESEEISVGGSDHVDVSVFEAFDYFALGHIHRPQAVGNVCYCGAPIKYSFSEAGHGKSVTVVEMGKKGECSVSRIPLFPKRDLREIRGTYMELTDRKNYEGTDREAYLHITLTDEEDIPEAVGRLRAVYPNLMKLDYDNQRTRAGVADFSALPSEKRTPAENFGEFFEMQNGASMSREQREFVERLIGRIWKEET